MFKNLDRAPRDLASGYMVPPGGTAELDLSSEHDSRLVEEGVFVDVDRLEADNPYEPEPEAELSGEALEQAARELNIEGRSKMSADELRAAVAAASADQEVTQ